MNIRVHFFQNDILHAIKGGVYQISLQKDDGERRVLYIGESFSMLIRCAQHLYQLRKNPLYFGMNDEILRSQNLILAFEVLHEEVKMGIRRNKEKEYIKNIAPLLQSGISDRMLSIPKKKEAMANFLEK
ncbi:TPA: hypothetical protein TX976_001144 [Streptococcus suis]|nr:hypothetical protein [Streptococcus suis]HEM2825488.1 hypothetical protein [Streptococcus suis]HEM4402938.1 hypothetical protein [Streptococcus suis]